MPGGISEKTSKAAERWLAAIERRVDTDLIEQMPNRLVVYMLNQILMEKVPLLEEVSRLVAHDGTDGNLEYLAEGVATTLDHLAAKAWNEIHQMGLISIPLPEEFRSHLVLPKEGPLQWK